MQDHDGNRYHADSSFDAEGTSLPVLGLALALLLISTEVGAQT